MEYFFYGFNKIELDHHAKIKAKSIYWLAKIRAYQIVGKKFRYSFDLVPTNTF